MRETTLFTPEFYVARSSLKKSDGPVDVAAHVRADILRSWSRCRNRSGNRGRETASNVQGNPGRSRLTEAARAVLSGFFESDPDSRSSVVVTDLDHRLCLRYDGDQSLKYVLDSAGMFVESDAHERRLGTNAGYLCLLTGTAASVIGPEHWNDELSTIAEAASPIRGVDGSVCGAVVVINHLSEYSPMASSVSKFLARQVHTSIADVGKRGIDVLAEYFAAKAHNEDHLVLATDGTHLFTYTSTFHRAVRGGDLEGVIAHARSALLNGEFKSCRIMTTSGLQAAVDVEPVFYLGEVTGCVLTATTASVGDELTGGEAVQRQGTHIGRVGPRDYASNPVGSDRRRRRQQGRNQALLNPYLRARQAVAVNIAEQRSHLLSGEPGTGKSTMPAAIFTAQHPGAGIETIDCARLDVTAVVNRWSTPTPDQTPHRLLILRSLNSLDINDARALNSALAALAEATHPPVVIGCVDTTAIDPSRLYALLGTHFHEVIRIPALRHRVDDIGDIARSILRDISPRHSFRLGMQVVRVFEGYSWPGNISELKDVLRHVVANKPFGEIQPSDLPRLHFRDVTRKLSPLDTAQCDTIIQALYEVGGNRYEAAALLGISRSSLYRKIDAFGISYIG